nr:hypothetical protein [Kibdelosporangium sp. MJ126-NF4]
MRATLFGRARADQHSVLITTVRFAFPQVHGRIHVPVS